MAGQKCRLPDCGGSCIRGTRTNQGYKWKCRLCASEFYVKPKARPALMTGQPCSVCGGPTASNNKTGICTLNPACRTKWYAEQPDKPEDAERPPTHKRYPDAKYELYDDGIVDDIAIQLAVSGARKVRLTPKEQTIAIRKMLKLQFTPGDIRDRLGICYDNMAKLLDPMGYEIIPDPAMSEAKNKRMLITRKDRARVA